MIKHVGKHGQRKVVIVFRQIPGEDHMCLILYSDQLPSLIHDEVMKCLESPVGQQANDLADALFRQTMADGRNCLDSLHREGLMKKIRTDQVYVTPNNKTSVRLDEMNGLINQMEQGKEAVQKMAEMDASQGMRDPAKVKKVREGRELGMPAEPVAPVGVLTDADLAEQRASQAQRMRREAEQLLAEATKLEAESGQLNSKNVPTKKTRKKTAA
jgi:cell division protein FtsB